VNCARNSVGVPPLLGICLHARADIPPEPKGDACAQAVTRTSNDSGTFRHVGWLFGLSAQFALQFPGGGGPQAQAQNPKPPITGNPAPCPSLTSKVQQRCETVPLISEAEHEDLGSGRVGPTHYTEGVRSASRPCSFNLGEKSNRHWEQGPEWALWRQNDLARQCRCT
jgi:hypothetical protein